MADLFDSLSESLAATGPAAALDSLAAALQGEGRWHELFDLRLVQCRLRLGLPAYLAQSADELPADQREALEDGYLAACREAGRQLLSERRIREAWMYLRPVGDRRETALALAEFEPTDADLEGVLDVALQQGVAPARGVQLMLAHYGTCNTISAVDGNLAQWSPADRRAAVRVLVEHIHRELCENVRHDIARREGASPPESTLAELLRAHSGLLDDDNYHLDTSHLHAVTRMARLLEAPQALELALDLTEYGRRLSAHYQYPGEEPFAEFYPRHGLFFGAQLGRDVDAAIEHFRHWAYDESLRQYSTLAAETYVVLLARLGRCPEALAASVELLPPGTPTGGFAPALSEIARQGGLMPQLAEIFRQRGDVVGYATSMVEQHGQRRDAATPR